MNAECKVNNAKYRYASALAEAQTVIGEFFTS